MSGVEVLALVTAVMTVIQFASETASMCKTIYDGKPTAASDVHTRATWMVDATGTMHSRRQAFRPLSPDERTLADIAKKCHHIATDLQKEVGDIETSQAKGDLIRAMRGAFKAYKGKSKVEKLERLLGDYETTIQTHLMVRLWSVYL